MLPSANPISNPQHRALSLLYRAAQRVFVCDISQLMLLDRVQLRAPAVEPQFTFRLLNAGEVARLAADRENELPVVFAERIQSGRDLCHAAFSGEHLAAYVWLAAQSIEAEHNSGRNRRSGVAVSFPADTVFVYKAFTRPEFRGHGLYSALLERSLHVLEARGVSRLVTTAEWNNHAALHVCRRLGFESLGTILRFACGPLAFTIKPPLARQLNIRLGRSARVEARATNTLSRLPEAGTIFPELLLSGAAAPVKR